MEEINQMKFTNLDERCSKELKNILVSCLQYDPSKRPDFAKITLPQFKTRESRNGISRALTFQKEIETSCKIELPKLKFEDKFTEMLIEKEKTKSKSDNSGNYMEEVKGTFKNSDISISPSKHGSQKLFAPENFLKPGSKDSKTIRELVAIFVKFRYIDSSLANFFCAESFGEELIDVLVKYQDDCIARNMIQKEDLRISRGWYGPKTRKAMQIDLDNGYFKKPIRSLTLNLNENDASGVKNEFCASDTIPKTSGLFENPIPRDNQEAVDFALNVGSEKSKLNQIKLHISCAELINVDTHSLTDSACVAYLLNQKTNTYSKVGETEVITDNLNPVFVKSILMYYCFEEIQEVNIKVFDIDYFSPNVSVEQNLIGNVNFRLGELLHSPNYALSLPK